MLEAMAHTVLMAGLDPAIREITSLHVGVDARNKSGHDELDLLR